MKTVYFLIVAHMLGDYVLQPDFLAKTKGENMWHMFAHCILYSMPFAIFFGFDWRVWWLIATHIIIDMAKARWHKIGYAADQVLHIFVLCLYALYGIF